MQIHEIIFLVILFIGYFSSSCLVCSMVGGLMKNIKGGGSGTEASMAFLLVFGLLVIFIVIGSGARKNIENFCDCPGHEVLKKDKLERTISWQAKNNVIY